MVKSVLPISGALARPSGRAPRCINEALPDGRASAPHYEPTCSNTQLPQYQARWSLLKKPPYLVKSPRTAERKTTNSTILGKIKLRGPSVLTRNEGPCLAAQPTCQMRRRADQTEIES